MPSDLRFEPVPVSMAPLGPESTPPDLIGTQILQNQLTFELDETDELYEGYGRVPNAFPYRSFSCYSRQLSEQKIQGAVLENRYLRAVFLPELGGRLWWLTDKVTGQELLYTNDVIRFSNLAVRDAWFSGGVEWNVGVIGHTPLTTCPLFTAQLHNEAGDPVLRMYGYDQRWLQQMERYQSENQDNWYFLLLALCGAFQTMEECYQPLPAGLQTDAVLLCLCPV